MPIIHDKQSAQEMIQTILWWGDKFKTLGRYIKRWWRSVIRMLRLRKRQDN